MPSPTDRTWPTSLTSASAPKFWISRFRIAEISAGWMFMFSFLRSDFASASAHRVADAVQFRAKRRVDHARADFDDEAAEERRIDLRLEAWITSELGFDRSLEFGNFAVGKRARRRDLRIDLAADLRKLCVESANNVGERKQP